MAMNNSLAEVHPELVSEWSEKNLLLTPDGITFGSNKKVWWKGTCGHEWQTSVKGRSNGEKCLICSGARVIAGINDLATLETLLAKQWSKKNKIKPTEVSIGSHKKVIWRCKKGHEWEAVVKSRTINKTGCPYCSHNKVLAGFNDLATLLPDIAAEWSDRNYPLLPTQVTVFANRKAWWKCKARAFMLMSQTAQCLRHTLNLQRRYDDDVAIICNEEGKMRGLPLNRAVYVQDNDKKEMVDIICGKFFICYAPPESESFQGLPDDMMKKYKEQFKYPERFSKEVGGNIVAEPFKPKSKDYER